MSTSPFEFVPRASQPLGRSVKNAWIGRPDSGAHTATRKVLQERLFQAAVGGDIKALDEITKSVPNIGLSAEQSRVLLEEYFTWHPDTRSGYGLLSPRVTVPLECMDPGVKREILSRKMKEALQFAQQGMLQADVVPYLLQAGAPISDQEIHDTARALLGRIGRFLRVKEFFNTEHEELSSAYLQLAWGSLNSFRWATKSHFEETDLAALGPIPRSHIHSKDVVDALPHDFIDRISPFASDYPYSPNDAARELLKDGKGVLLEELMKSPGGSEIRIPEDGLIMAIQKAANGPCCGAWRPPSYWTRQFCALCRILGAVPKLPDAALRGMQRQYAESFRHFAPCPEDEVNEARDLEFEAAIGMPRDMPDKAFAAYRFCIHLQVPVDNEWFERGGKSPIPESAAQEVVSRALNGLQGLSNMDSAVTLNNFLQGTAALKNLRGCVPPVDRTALAEALSCQHERNDAYSAFSLYLWDWAYHGQLPDPRCAAALHADLLQWTLVREPETFPPSLRKIEQLFNYRFPIDSKPQRLESWLENLYADIKTIFAQHLYLACLDPRAGGRQMSRSIHERIEFYEKHIGQDPDPGILCRICAEYGADDPEEDLRRRVEAARASALGRIYGAIESVAKLDEIFGPAELSAEEAEALYESVLLRLYPFEGEGENEGIYWANVSACVSYIEAASQRRPSSALIQRAYRAYFDHRSLSAGGIEHFEQVVKESPNHDTVDKACRKALERAVSRPDGNKMFSAYDALSKHYRHTPLLSDEELSKLFAQGSALNSDGTAVAGLVTRLGRNPADDFLKKNVLGRKSFHACLRIPLSAEALRAHFEDPGNTTIDEFGRIYAIFDVREYFDRLISEFERQPAVNTREAHIKLLTAMAKSDISDEKRFAELFGKLTAFRGAMGEDLSSLLAESFAELIRAGADDLRESLCHPLIERARAQDAEAVAPLSLDEDFCLSALCLSGSANTSRDLSLLPLFLQSGVSTGQKSLLLEYFSNGEYELPSEMVDHMRLALDGKVPFDWREVEFAEQVNRIPNRDLAVKALTILGRKYRSTKSLDTGSESLGEKKAQLGAQIAHEAFVPVYFLAAGDDEVLATLAGVFDGLKRKQARDSLLFGAVQLAYENRYRSWDLSPLFRQIVAFSPRGEEDAERVAQIFRGAAFFIKVSDLLRPPDFDLLMREVPCRTLEVRGLSLPELAAGMRKRIADQLQTILPDERITVEQIDCLEKEWSSVEPIFTYAGKLAAHRYTDELAYLAEIIAHFDPPEYRRWNAWRYGGAPGTRQEAAVTQLQALDKTQKRQWEMNQFCELGTVWVNSGARDPGPAVVNFMRHAIRHNHLGGLDLGAAGRQLKEVFTRVDERPQEASPIIGEAVQRLRLVADDLDTVIQHRAVDRLDSFLACLSGEIALNTKLKDTLRFVEQFLRTEQVTILRAVQFEEGQKAGLGEQIVPAAIQEALHARSQEIKEKFERLRGEGRLDAWGLAFDPAPPPQTLFALRSQVSAVQTLLDLCTLEASNAITGKISAHGKSLAAAFRELRAVFKGNTVFMQDLNNIERACRVGDEEQSRRHLGIAFTDDPEILLQIGKYPIGCGSCQNYEGDPSLNRALLGYLGDAHIRAALLIDLGKLREESRSKLLKGGTELNSGVIPAAELLNASVGRAIIKCVTDALNRPAIFLEPTYSSVNKANLTFDKYFNLFFYHMVARPMGVRLLRGGGAEQVKCPKSRNISGQYEDSDTGNAQNAGMGIRIDAYAMPAHEVKIDAPSTPEEIEIAERVRSMSRRP